MNRKFLFAEVCHTSIISVILYGLGAVIWSVRAVFDILEIINHTSMHSTIWVVGDVLCSIIWIAAFVVQVRRYRSNNDE